MPSVILVFRRAQKDHRDVMAVPLALLATRRVHMDHEYVTAVPSVV